MSMAESMYIDKKHKKYIFLTRKQHTVGNLNVFKTIELVTRLLDSATF